VSDRLQRWLAGGLRTVLLGSGEIFAVKLPDTEDMLAKGLIPQDLRAIALKFGASSLDVDTLDTEELARLLRFMRGLVAYMLRYVWDGPIEPIEDWQKYDATDKRWQPVTLTVADLEEGSIDGDDYAALQGIATRQFSVAELTALHLRDRSLISQAEADRQTEAGKKDTTKAWGSFRRQPGRAEPSGKGGEVAGRSDQPAPARKPDRPGRGVRARRRSVPSADRG
jgi:hypothetical protein